MNDDRLEELDETQRARALRLREMLRESEAPDGVTSARLSAARARALSASGQGVNRGVWWASGGLTAAAILAALLVQLAPRRVSVESETAAVEALEVLTDDVDTEFYEDLEMYRWLEQDSRA